MKANQELKNMLVKEVNDFQMELYKFCVKTRETQVKLQRDIDSINANFNYTSQDAQQLRKECSSEELRGAIVQLKLELVRACAVIAEARTHAEAKEYHQWTQADPLTTKRVASVKKLAYYVQTQLEQAQKALDYKWNEALSRDTSFNKPGQRMIRPILDDVYQPLVKQQEILSRQQAVLRTLRNTLNECDVTPMFKTTSLLRSTPFRNKDPLSKLTKNILNMSLDTTDNKKKEPLLSSQKLDALRDMLSNHKTVKIKPVNVEMRQHLATMRINYEKSLKEKVQAQPIKTEPDVKLEVKLEEKPSPIITPKVEPFTPTAVYKPQVMPPPQQVARTLFPQVNQEPVQKPQPQVQVPQPKPAAPPFAFSSTPAPAETRSVLKDLLQSKQAAKNDANTFMGQSICSPSSFAFTATTTSAKTTPTSPPSVFTAKPISDINNMFNKFQPQAFGQEPKPQAVVPEPKPLFDPKPAATQPSPVVSPSKQLFPSEPKQQTSIFSTPKSSETGEPEESKGVGTKKVDKLTNLFAMKTSTPIASPIVPDVLKSTQDVKTDKDKPVEKEKAKENVPEKVEQKPVPKPLDNKELSVSFTIQSPNKSSLFGSSSQPVESSSTARPLSPTKPLEGRPSLKSETPIVSEKTDASSTSTASIFGITSSPAPVTANKPEEKSEPTPSKLETAPETESTASKSSLFSSPSPSAASVFGAAVASPTKPTSPAASIFAAAVSSSSATSVFGSSSQGSIFGSTSPTKTTASVFGSTAQSVFSGAGNVTKPSVFSTPTPSSPTPSSPTSLFGSSPTTTQPGSIFSSSFAQPSVFAASTTTAASPTSVFGSSTASSVFGSSPATGASVFGASTTTTASVFGSTTPKTQASVFGSAVTSNANAFSSATTPASGAQSLFASAAANSNKPLFGGTATPVVFGSQGSGNQTSVFGTVTTQASVFGSSTATTQSSVFGSPIATSQPSVFGSVPTTQASVFGSGPTTQASVFGAQPTTTAQSSSLFGGAEASLFASASISTTSAPSPTSGGSIFGQSSGSVFGGGSSNVFGSKATFGQPNPSTAAIFGGGGATAFGQQKPANNFWTGGNTDGGFGSTGFGQQPTTQASSIFGGTTGGSFSTPSPAGQAFGSPQQPAFGSGDTTSSVFGSPQQQAASPAFGGSPVFGTKPVFGQTSGFGSPPNQGGFGSPFGGFNKSPSGFGAPAAFGGGATFGGGAAFGGSSPGKVFGGAAPAPSFGAPTQSNATFENLATQNTLTFGNLAQQSSQPQPQQPSFNTSPSFKAWRG